jgi:hypothetical protein
MEKAMSSAALAAVLTMAVTAALAQAVRSACAGVHARFLQARAVSARK